MRENFSKGGVAFGVAELTFEAVSYTHLDVYKRQIQMHCLRISLHWMMALYVSKIHNISVSLTTCK